MKKKLSFLLCIAFLFTLTACQVEDIADDSDKESKGKTVSAEEATEKATEPESIQPEIEEIPLQDGYGWVYGDGKEAAAFARILAHQENPTTYYIYDLNGDGLGELIFAPNGEDLVVYEYTNGSIGASAADADTRNLLSGLTAYSGYEALSGIYSQQSKIQTPLVEVFTKVDPLQFSNGRETILVLEDNTVLLIDTTVPSVKIYSQLKYNENILGVTKHSVYFTYYDEDFGIGTEIYSLDRNGAPLENYGNVRSGFYIPGYVLIQNTRTDVSPTTLSIYNNEDEAIVDKLCAWPAREDGGNLYYMELSRDPYEDFDNEDPLTLTMVRLDTNGITALFEVTVGPGHIASLYDGQLMIMDEGVQTFYNIATGEVVEQKVF